MYMVIYVGHVSAKPTILSDINIPSYYSALLHISYGFALMPQMYFQIYVYVLWCVFIWAKKTNFKRVLKGKTEWNV